MSEADAMNHLRVKAVNELVEYKEKLAASEAKVAKLTEALKNMKDAAEMLWTVLANVSGGDWEKQSSEWQGAAARWRDNYFAALKEAGHE